MSTVATTPMSADQLLLLPHDGRQRYELVAGELRTRSPAGYEHGTRASALLYVHVEQHNLGEVTAAETGFIIRRNPDTVRAPDAGFVSNDTLQQFGRPTRGYYPHGPDLAVEVLSPDESQAEIDEKIEDWFAGGARSVWIVNPRRKTVTVYRSLEEIRVLTERDVLESEDVVTGFTCPVARLFR